MTFFPQNRAIMEFSKMTRVRQITSSHCCSAVLSSLFSFLGVKVSQRKITSSLRVQNKIKKYGLNMNQMGKAVKIYGEKGKYIFWKKSNAKISDLNKLVNKYKFPVGVEWQGSFGVISDDVGPYSVVTKVDMAKGFLNIADPFREFSKKDRKFEISEFKKRWWDTNIINKKVVFDRKVMFVITPRGVDFPKRIGMIKG